MTYSEWAQRHPQAAAELTEVTAQQPAPAPANGFDEDYAQQQVRFAVARAGGYIWRNNVGATPAKIQVKCPKCYFNHYLMQRPIRYGLANDSHQLNSMVKSADLIGVMPVRITTEMVGKVIGQFLAVEAKRPGWKYSGKGREGAQQAFLSLVSSKGGKAMFSTGEVAL